MTAHERLAEWQSVHKLLLDSDSGYRKRHTAFLVTLIGLSGIMFLFYLPFIGIRIFGFVVDVSIIAVVATLIMFLTLRQFLFQNRRIQSYLQSSR